MCTTFLSLFRRKNKVAPVPLTVLPYSQRLMSYAEREIERENALLRREISTQTSASLTHLVENQSSETPAWLTYNIDLDGNIVAEGFKRQPPRKLEKDPQLTVLTLEMLLEKQEEAEKKRTQEIDSKREKAAMQNKSVQQKRELSKAKKNETLAEKIAERERKVAQNREQLIKKRKEKARKSVEIANPRNLAAEYADKTNKAVQILQKQLRAEEKRKEQLELVKTKANKGGVAFNLRNQHTEAERVSKLQEREQEIKRRAASATTNRDRALRKVVQKQQQRESYAKKLRARVAQQQKDEEEFIAEQQAGEIEVDEYYFQESSESEQDDDDFWQ